MKTFLQFCEAKKVGGEDQFLGAYDHGWIDNEGHFLRHNPGGTLNHDEVAQHFKQDSGDAALKSGWARFSVTGTRPELSIEMLMPSNPAVDAICQAIKQWPYEGVVTLDVWDGKKMQHKSFREAREAVSWLNSTKHSAA